VLLPAHPEAMRDRCRFATAGYTELGQDSGDMQAGWLRVSR
jgi:hypothetical protein